MFSLSFLKSSSLLKPSFDLETCMVSILGVVGSGPTTLPLRHSDLLEKRMSYCDLCSKMIYGYYLELVLCVLAPSV